MEKLSVLMTVYYKDNSLWFEEALNSVFNQDLIPGEVVLVEDGPLTNDLYGVVDKFKLLYGSMLKIIKSPLNIGQGPALNLGLKECSNAYIARMDSDDICHKDRFLKQLTVMVNSKYDIISSWVEDFEANTGKKIGIRKVPERNKEIRVYVKTRCPFNHVAVMYRKEKVTECGGYSDQTQMQDYILWAKMLKEGSIGYNLQEVLVDVRICGNFSRKRGGSYFREELELQSVLLQNGIISRQKYYTNLILRGVSRLIPAVLVSFIYRTILRD